MFSASVSVLCHKQFAKPPEKPGFVSAKGYKGTNDEQRVEDVRLEGEESQTHVGEDEVLCQEVQQLKQLLDDKKSVKSVCSFHWSRFN